MQASTILFWSPDSKRIVFINDLQEIKLLTIDGASLETIDKTTDLPYNGLQGFGVNWSPDNKWIAYSKGTENLNSAIFLYDVVKKKINQATSGYYNDADPVFDPTGKYLFFTTNRSFTPAYSNFDNTWIYPNSTQLAVATLDPSTPELLYAKNDEIKLDTGSTAKAPADTTKKVTKPVVASNNISPESLESRLEILPVTPGNLGGLFAADGKLVYMRFPNTGAAQGPGSLYLFDIEKREEKLLLDKGTAYTYSADRKNILARTAAGFGIIKVNPDQKLDKLLRTSEIEMVLKPKEEWTQMFNDTWRRYRDFFYDPGMQQVDWNEVRKEYSKLLDDAITRWDVNNILQEMVSGFIP